MWFKNVVFLKNHQNYLILREKRGFSWFFQIFQILAKIGDFKKSMDKTGEGFRFDIFFIYRDIRVFYYFTLTFRLLLLFSSHFR